MMNTAPNSYLDNVSMFLYGRKLRPEEYASKLFHGIGRLPGMASVLTPGAADQAARLVGRAHSIMTPAQGTHTAKAMRRYRDVIDAFPERLAEGLLQPGASAAARRWAADRLAMGAQAYRDINKATWLDHWGIR